ncbi:hypothetical protein HS088_TW14G01256 [Tripterygium wilfordii]|uniref:Uncharacterized protein n=1 Tax=Tripterygium wilfordii TaxID=458696 RepID=A0A7J7CT07_TRIWF|nr:hypothetical protein HS088_TW14G01256 [Tripterygium wilfordii]
MPSLQTALPPELADNLYRECLRRAKYIGHQTKDQNVTFRVKGSFMESTPLILKVIIGPFVMQQHNTPLLVQMVGQQFKRHKHETDPEKIQKLKD